MKCSRSCLARDVACDEAVACDDSKDRLCAQRIVLLSVNLPRGARAAVAGNGRAHAERLVSLVREYAAAHGFDVSHVTFTPVGADELAAANAAAAFDKRGRS